MDVQPLGSITPQGLGLMLVDQASEPYGAVFVIVVL